MRRVARLSGLAACVLAAPLAAACGGMDTSAAMVEHQAVSIDLLADGSIQVREALRLRVFAGPVGEFRRVVPGDRVDAFFDVVAWLDGRPLEADENDNERVTVFRGDALDVRWHFAPVTDTTRELVLEYRASGAMSVHGANGLVYWPVLPLDPAYPVVSSELGLTIPPRAVFMTPPAIEASGAWTTTVSERGLTATRSGIAPGESAVVVVRAATATMAAAQPAWQFDAALAAELVPAFLSGGLFMVVVGVGVVWMLRARYPDPRRVGDTLDAPSPVSLTALPPAFETALRHRRSLRGGPELRAALERLARRGAAADVLPHERVIADELWLQRQGEAGAGDPRASALRGIRRRFRKALLDDLVAAGLVDEERAAVATGLKAAGIAVIAMGLACAGAVPLLLSRYGDWAQAVPAGIVVLGLMLLAEGWRFVIVTPAGARRGQLTQ